MNDPNDREFKLLILNALDVLLFEEDMDEAEWYKKRENIKLNMKQLFVKETNRE